MVDFNKEIDVENIDIAYIHDKAQSEFKKLSGNKILITGAGGFLGFFLFNQFLLWIVKTLNEL